jgi:hypothetical protein
MKTLFQFNLDCGRMGELEGVFVAEYDDVFNAYGKKCYFGEVLGKHSEVTTVLEPTMIMVMSSDQEFIEKLLEVFRGENISGFNPLRYLED